MSEQLGELKKPSVDQFRGGRKLFFVPLVLIPATAEAALSEMVNRYWEEAQVQIRNLEEKLGQATELYHEIIPDAGERGMRAIEELSSESYRIVKCGLETGAQLQCIEDTDLLTELMDWSRCLAIGLQNESVINRVYESFVAVQKKRNEYITRRIDETLKEGETGVLLMREGHGIQFASDINVFYIAPPALDEIKRWIRARENQVGRESPDRAEEKAEDKAEDKAQPETGR